MSIFEENKLNPPELMPFKTYFKNQFDAIFLAFLPFFRVKDKVFKPHGQQLSKKVSLTEAQDVMPALKALKKAQRNIYLYQNDHYPTESEVLSLGERVTWESLRAKAGFSNLGEMHKALRTSIGGLRKPLRREDLAERLRGFTKSEKIYHPAEGRFDPFTKFDIYKAMHLLEKNKLVVDDEFYQKRKELDLDNLKKKDFSHAICSKDYYIYSADESVLFSIGWDDFFYLICSDKPSIEKIRQQVPIEGFYCDNKTNSNWYWTEEELNQLSL